MKTLQFAVREQQFEAQVFAARLFAQKARSKSSAPWRADALRTTAWTFAIVFCATVWAAVFALGARLFL